MGRGMRLGSLKSSALRWPPRKSPRKSLRKILRSQNPRKTSKDRKRQQTRLKSKVKIALLRLRKVILETIEKIRGRKGMRKR